MLKLVIDTNVVISALLKPESNPALIMSLILRGDCRIFVTETIFAEYTGVLGRDKFKILDRAIVKEFLSALRAKGLWVVPKVLLDEVTKDPDDNAFLECALESKADFLITDSNTQHSPERKFPRTSIVTPGEFIAYIAKLIKQRFSQRFNRHINITWARGDFIRNGGSIQHCSGLGGNEGTGAKGRLARWGYEPGEDKRG